MREGCGLRISNKVWNDMLQHLMQEYPREGVGVIVATSLDKDSEVNTFIPLSNTATDEAHFRIDPKEWVSFLHTLDNSGGKISAIVHSHPRTAAVPSWEDKQNFFYPNAFMIIVSLQNQNEPEAQLYEKIGSRMLSCRLEISVE